MVWFDILVFAAVAAFLAYRLHQVLGERHEDEPKRGNPFDPARDTTPPPAVLSPEADQPGNVIPLPKPVFTSAPDSLAGKLERIAAADPNFSEKSFINGARAAFKLIVEAFAAEDLPTLQPLLSDDVYSGFAAAIRARQAAKEKLETKVARITEAEIVDASLNVNTARVTLRFVSEQVQATRDSTGTVISGDDVVPKVVTDLWTFTRNTRASDPNWHLAETRAAS